MLLLDEHSPRIPAAKRRLMVWPLQPRSSREAFCLKSSHVHVCSTPVFKRALSSSEHVRWTFHPLRVPRRGSASRRELIGAPVHNLSFFDSSHALKDKLNCRRYSVPESSTHTTNYKVHIRLNLHMFTRRRCCSATRSPKATTPRCRPGRRSSSTRPRRRAARTGCPPCWSSTRPSSSRKSPSSCEAMCTTLAAAPSTALSWLTDRRPDRWGRDRPARPRPPARPANWRELRPGPHSLTAPYTFLLL